QEIARYRECCISIISWMEVLAGARTEADEDVRRGFLAHFRIVPLTPEVAEEAVRLRRQHRLKLPDAIIWASALNENCVMVSRNTRINANKQAKNSMLDFAELWQCQTFALIRVNSRDSRAKKILARRD